MRKNNEKLRQETDQAFALATFLLNILIILILCGSVWTFYSLAAQSGSLELFLRDYKIHQ